MLSKPFLVHLVYLGEKGQQLKQVACSSGEIRMKERKRLVFYANALFENEDPSL